jgi:diguanylate cyclase
MVARLGGEEFVILFEDLEAIEAARILDAAREILGARHFKVRETDAPLGQVTFSAGVACGRSVQSEPGLQRADALLYRAKNAGRNQVCFEGA